MILRALSSNQPYTLIAVPVVIVAALLPACFTTGLPLLQVNFPADELFAWIYRDTFSVVICAITLLSAGSLYANSIFNRHEFFNVPVYVPAFMYALLGSSICLIQTSLPALLGNIFILAGLNRQLKIFRQTRVLAEYFESGFWYGMAAVFFPPFLLLAAGMWLTTLFTRAFNWREHLLPIIAFAVPFLYWLAWKYWNNEMQDLVLFRKIFSYNNSTFSAALSWSQKSLLIFTGICFVMALPRYLFLSDRASNKARSVKNVFIAMAAAISFSCTLGYFLLGEWIYLSTLVALVFIIGYWFTNYRYSLIAPLVFYVLCIAGLFSILHFYSIVSW